MIVHADNSFILSSIVCCSDAIFLLANLEVSIRKYPIGCFSGFLKQHYAVLP